MNSGIYKISSLIDDRIYVGSAVSIDKRKQSHLRDLRNDQHHSGRLQNFFNKYGEENIRFDVIELCDKEALLQREQFYIDTLNPFFNICRVAGNCTGRKMTEFGRKRNTEIHTGNKYNLGKKHNDETKEKMRQKKLGRKASEETKAKMSAQAKGRKFGPMSEEQKKVLSEIKKGKRLSEEHKRNIAEGNRGRIVSAETREKIRDTNIKTWAKIMKDKLIYENQTYINA